MIRVGEATIYQGDCLEVLAAMEADSIDSIVTDPPYGLSFMGKDWDHGIPGEHFWREVLRVAKPGACLLAMGGTRTFHRLTCAIEDAGWEIRDCLMWVYGQGFPKSLDVSKAIDKEAGAERRSLGPGRFAGRGRTAGRVTNALGSYSASENDVLTAPVTDAAKRWQGWGTALKPAWEPIILARKPLEGTVAANVQKWGTGALNIDGCRVAGAPPSVPQPALGVRERRTFGFCTGTGRTGEMSHAIGRFPANLMHDGSEEVVETFPGQAGDHGTAMRGAKPTPRSGNGIFAGGAKSDENCYSDSGSAARFFYCAKASRAERYGSKHPTVKPVALFRYLVRLVTPPGGTVLDMFAGTGVTGQAALEQGFRCVLIEREAEYLADIRKRLASVTPQKVEMEMEEAPLFAQRS